MNLFLDFLFYEKNYYYDHDYEILNVLVNYDVIKNLLLMNLNVENYMNKNS
jgi:hypothetical protein